MLSTKNVSPGAKAYYKEDNYYSKEASESHSQWQGKGAQTLGLEGSVNDEIFGLLLHGRLPDKTKFRHRPPTQASYQERGALDLTFSAPKSISLLTQIGGDRALEEAHHAAVAKTLDYLEKHYAATRIRRNGERHKVNTGNLVVAKFRHDTSRQLDPQLHTHCLVLNMTQTENGRWYSLSNDAIHKNKLLLGTIYQNELARGAMRLGYDIQRNGNGTFEIAGFQKHHLDYFSKRRQEIEKYIDEFSTWREKQDVCLKVRERKVEIDRRELQDYWLGEAQAVGLVMPQPRGRDAELLDVSQASPASTYEQHREHHHDIGERRAEISRTRSRQSSQSTARRAVGRARTQAGAEQPADRRLHAGAAGEIGGGSPEHRPDRPDRGVRAGLEGQHPNAGVHRPDPSFVGDSDAGVREDGERQPGRIESDRDVAGAVAERLNRRHQEAALSRAISQLEALKARQEGLNQQQVEVGSWIAATSQWLQSLDLKMRPNQALAQRVATALNAYKAASALEAATSAEVLKDLGDQIAKRKQVQAEIARSTQQPDAGYRQFLAAFERALQTVTDRFTARRVAVAVARQQSENQLVTEGIQESLAEAIAGLEASGDRVAETRTLVQQLSAQIQQLGRVLDRPTVTLQASGEIEEKVGAVPELESSFETVEQAVEAGIEHCAERTVAFRPEKIVKFVLEELGSFAIDDIEAAVEGAPELLRYGQFVTTDGAVRRELDTIRTVLEQQERLDPICSPERVAQQLEATERLMQEGESHWRWTSGQLDAVELAATSRDRFVAWQGVAGAGKTSALDQLKALATEAGYSVRAYAPTAKAAKVLSDELGLEGQTVARLTRQQDLTSLGPQLWIVDEAGMISAEAGQQLVRKAMEANARVVFVGDTRQLSAVEAGNPFKSLQQAGMKTAYLQVSRRQKNPGLKAAVDLAARGKIEESIAQLDRYGMTHYHKYRLSRQKQAIADYLALPPVERENTLVIAGTNQDREALTAGIREGLRREGSLGEEVAAIRLGSKNLTRAQQKYVHHYEVGDILIPNRKLAGMQAWERYEVTGTEGDRLRVRGGDGFDRIVAPSSHWSVFYQKSVDVSVGDILRWRRNDTKAHRRNGQEFCITEVDGRIATVQYPSGRMERIDLDRPQHFDHAIVTTTYGSQGKTCGRVFMLAEDDGTLNRESFYVGISRAKYGVKVYAEQRATLVEAAGRSQANENPVEAVEGWLETLNKLLADSETYRQHLQTRPYAPVESVPTAPSPQLLDRLAPQHRHEMLVESAIAPDVAELNVRSVSGQEARDLLLTSPELYTSSGELKVWAQRRYDHVERGGWVFQGVDPLRGGERMDWVRFKPDCPKSAEKEDAETGEIRIKPIKYESTPKTATRAMFAAYPERLWRQVARSYGVPIQESETGFWDWVHRTTIPIVITEGSKKGMAIASAGYVAIALPGVWNGARKASGELPERLIPELEMFATPGREVYFAFDADTKPRTVEQVNLAIERTAGLLEGHGCKVSIMSWEGEKGADDLIAAQGREAFDRAYAEAVPLAEWRMYTGLKPSSRTQRREDVPLVQHWPHLAKLAGRNERYIAKVKLLVAKVEGGEYLNRHNRELLHRDVLAGLSQLSKRVASGELRQRVMRGKQEFERNRQLSPEMLAVAREQSMRTARSIGL